MGIAERKERDKRKRRNAILRAAERVFFSKKGEDATMDDVAQRAEVSKGTLYLYFKNKEDLLYALAEKGVTLLTKHLRDALKESDSGIASLSEVGDAFIDFSLKQPGYFSLILKFEGKALSDEKGKTVKLFIEPALEVLYDVLVKGISDKTIRDDIGARELVSILWSQFLGILQVLSNRSHALHSYNIEHEWLIKGHFRLIMKGIRPD